MFLVCAAILVHCFNFSSLNSSSHSRFDSQSVCKKSFIGIVTGDTNPSGSNIEAMEAKTSRFVFTFLAASNFLVDIEI